MVGLESVELENLDPGDFSWKLCQFSEQNVQRAKCSASKTFSQQNVQQAKSEPDLLAALFSNDLTDSWCDSTTFPSLS
jgi:hypothetical protein